MAVVGLLLYWAAVGQDLLRARIGMPVYITALTIFLFAGQIWAIEALPRQALIAGWLASPPMITGIAWWLDRRTQFNLKRAV
jgi:hypothetical protein